MGAAADGDRSALPARRSLGPAARLIPPLWLVVGAVFAAAAPSTAGNARAGLIAIAVLCGTVGAATVRVDWGRLPDPLIATLPWAGGIFVATIALAAPDAPRLAAILLGLVVMYCGVAFHRARFVTALVLGALALTATTLAGRPGPARVWELVGTLVATASLGSALHWLRGLMDAEGEATLAAEAQRNRYERQAEAERDRAARHAADVLQLQLAHRAELAARLAEHSTALTRAAVEVSHRTSSVSTGSAELARALEGVATTARTCESITRAVAEKSARAGETVSLLSDSSRQILAASTVIHAVAEQTNLLALNATIESARAGRAGRGFAVVAAEVRNLARRSGENAESISGTLAQIQAQVAAAVAAVTEIGTSMAELSGHNGALAAAVHEQTDTVRQIAAAIHDAAAQTDAMSASVRALEQLARQD